MVAGQSLPSSAEAYFRTQATEGDAAIRAVRRQWSRISGAAVLESYADFRPMLLAVVLTAQSRFIRPVRGYFSSVLRETGQPDNPLGEALSRSLVGWSGDGRTIEGLLDVAPRITLARIGQGLDEVTALKAGQDFLDKAVTTALWDTARHAETLEVAVRPEVTGYVRMLNPGLHPPCSRCAILAGRWYRRNQGFERHPNCRCVHIPASERVAGDFRVNPSAYFDSLTEAEQDRVFTKAGAEVIRAGADPTQVVNARRGMTTAQISLRGWVQKGRQVPVERYGRQIYITHEGTTRHGRAYRARTGRPVGERLMPESIVALARDQDGLMRLLRHNGYLP